MRGALVAASPRSRRSALAIAAEPRRRCAGSIPLARGRRGALLRRSSTPANAAVVDRRAACRARLLGTAGRRRARPGRRADAGAHPQPARRPRPARRQRRRGGGGRDRDRAARHHRPRPATSGSRSSAPRVASVLVYAIGCAGRGGATPVRLALAGTAITAALMRVSSTAIALTDPRLLQTVQPVVGRLARRARTSRSSTRSLPFMVAGVLLAARCSRGR